MLGSRLFTNFPSSNAEIAGLQPAIFGTLWIIGVCAVFIVPIGVATAVYLEEYADNSKWWNRLIEVNIQNLAAVPSIVYGILGLAFLVRGPLNLGRVVLAGGMTLGLLVLPVVIIAGREAIRAVPPSIREGSMALGATKWQTIWKQVLPASIPGVATGVILALSRAIGETAPLIVVGAATFITFNPSGIVGDGAGFSALPIQIFSWISQPQDDFRQLAAAGIVLLLGLADLHERRGDLPAQPIREQVVMTDSEPMEPEPMSETTEYRIDAGRGQPGDGRRRAERPAVVGGVERPRRRPVDGRRLRARRASASCTAASRPSRTSRSISTRTRSPRSSGRPAAASRRSCAA